MAVVAINSGNFSNTSTSASTFYTCPAGRSARVEVFHVSNNSYNLQNAIGIQVGNSQLARNAVYYQYNGETQRTVLGNSPAGATFGSSNSQNSGYQSNSMSTIYVPASGQLKAAAMGGSFVAIEEDDG